MNYYSISALINFILSLILGGIVFAKNPKSKINLTFFLFAIAVASWSLSYFFWQIAISDIRALFWLRMLMAFAIFIPVFYLHFVFSLTGNHKRRVLTVTYIAFFVFLLIDLLTSQFVVGVKPVFSFRFWPIPGMVFHLFLLVWGAYVIYSTYLLYRLHQKSSGITKMQTKYLLLGMIIGFAGGSTNYFLWYGIPVPPVGNILVSVYVAMTAYVIIRHRFLDIRLVIARTIAYFLLIVILGIFYALGLFIFGTLLFPEANASGKQLLISVMLALILAFTFQPLKKILERITDKVFFRSGYNSNELLSRLTKITASTLNLEDLTKQTLHNLLVSMHIVHGTFLIFDNGNIYPPIYEGFSSQPHYDIETIKRLSDLRRIVIFEEENDESIKDLLRQFDFSLSLPLYVGDKLHGLLVLGEKKSGDIYSTQDIEVLGIFGPEISVAVQNAKAYEEIRRFNVTLKQEVERETKQLKDLTEQQKDQVDIMGHEVKTPLTVISQQLNLLLDMILTEEKRKEWFKGNIQPEDAKRVIDGLIKMRVAETQEELIVTNMVEAARLDKLRFELNYSTFDLIELVKLAIKDSEGRLEASKQEAKITLQAKFQNLEVEADQSRIKQCVDGLLTNAEKYGRNPVMHPLDVTVVVTTDNGTVSISVHDQGMGIDPNDTEKLGKKFSRLNPHTNGSKLPRPGGSGLGLYTYKGIIEHHQGQLIIQSDGIGKGSVFTLTFPLKRPLRQKML